MRVSTSTRRSSGSSVTSCAALAGFRCARISAIVCGCSPRMNFESCSGSAFSSEVKPAVDWNDRMTRSMIRRAASSPSVLLEHAPRVVEVAARHELGGDRDLVELVEHLLARASTAPAPSAAISLASVSISSSVRCLKTFAVDVLAEQRA